MPKPNKKKSLTGMRVLALALAFITLCIAGGVTMSVLFLPAVMGANNVAKAVAPSMQVEGIDFDVTNLPQKSTMYASDGKTVIAEFYAQNREVVPLKDISKPMMQAVVAREDKRFWEHSGVDVQGVMRAFVQTYMRKGDQQGGSSLTQQYVKNVLATKARDNDDPIAAYHATEDTIARKLREMLISVQMEKKYSKQEILQGYLNIAQFGSNSLYGVQAAAERYFNTTADKLNVVQAATIAMITKNPSKYDPSIPENQEEAQKQRNITLQLMHDQGFITQQEYEEAVNTPLVDTLHLTSVSRGCMAAKYDAGYFCDYVVHKIENSPEFGKTAEDRERLLQEGGLKIVTTLDLDANAAMMDVANATIPAADSSGMEIVMASVKPGTGEVLGFGLNRTYDATDAAATDPTRSSMNYAVDQIDGGGQGFQIGSSWKPINLVAWMQQGRSINESLVAPTDFLTNRFSCNGYQGGTDNWHVTNALTHGKPVPGPRSFAQHYDGGDGRADRPVRGGRRREVARLPQFEDRAGRRLQRHLDAPRAADRRHHLGLAAHDGQRVRYDRGRRRRVHAGGDQVGRGLRRQQARGAAGELPPGGGQGDHPDARVHDEPGRDAP